MITFASKKSNKQMKSRRTFLKIGLTGIVAFFAFAWNRITLNHIALNDIKSTVIPNPANNSVSFVNEYIIINKNNTICVLTAHCTHLGCKINKTENGHLVCPCHGSEYDLSGKVTKGPAYKSLNEVSFKISPDGTQLEING